MTQISDSFAQLLNAMDFLGAPFITMALIWIVIIVVSFLSYYFWRGSGQWPEIYENNQRLGANQRYVIRFRFGKQKNEFDIKKTTIKVKIFTEKNKVMSLFTIGPTLLRSAVLTKGKSHEIKFVLNRKAPMSKIIRVGLNHNGKGDIFVNTIEIQKVDWDKTNISYINEYIRSLPEFDAVLKQAYPSGTRENREVENEAIVSDSITYCEYLAFIWMAINLIPMFSVFLILCRTTVDKETDEIGTRLHLCPDYHDQLFSSVTTALISSSLTTITFGVLILFYRFAVKTGVAKGSDFCAIFKIIYIVVVVTIGAVSGVFAAFESAKTAKAVSKDVPHFEVHWVLAVGLGIVVFLMVWTPILSIFALFSRFFRKISSIKSLEDIPDFSQSDTKKSPKSKNTKEDKNEDMKQSETYHKAIMDNIKVKSVSQYPGPGVKPSKEKVAKNEAKAKADDQKVAKTSSQESIGEGYYKQLMKGQAKVKSISQY